MDTIYYFSHEMSRANFWAKRKVYKWLVYVENKFFAITSKQGFFEFVIRYDADSETLPSILETGQQINLFFYEKICAKPNVCEAPNFHF